MSDQSFPGVGPVGPPAKFLLGDRPLAPLTLERVRKLFVSRYDVIRELGSGGTSIVYLAHDRTHGRKVAIKVLRPELAAAVIAARFLREIEIGQQLTHPNVLPIEEWGTADGELFCTMPFVDGETLQQRMARETHLPITDTLCIARAVADALDCAHRTGLIHRDIKPGNILLSGDHVFVADFGIARAMSVATTSSLTESGVVIGTAAYMSPEQGSADKSLDARADIYSLGCVVYEMLGGEPPFTGPTARAIIARHAHEPPRSLRVIRPSVPLAVQRALEKALAKVPADRFATAGEFVSALETGATELDRVQSSWRDVASNMRRHPLSATLSVAVIAGAAWWSASHMETSRQAAALAMLDTTRYVVVAGDTSSLTESAAVAARAALQEWTGISVVEPSAPRKTAGTYSRSEAAFDSDTRAVASAAKAGRLLRVQALKTGDSARIRGTLVDARRAMPIADATVRGVIGIEHSSAVANDLVERLLFPKALGPTTSRSDVGTHSVPARQAFLRGQVAVGNWTLDLADSAFRRATELDPGYAAASLWLAQVRQWKLAPVAQWQFAADQALARDSALSRPARTIAHALSELARGRREVACARWAAMTRADGEEFVPWYSQGNCLRYDSLVVRDVRSRSGWRFRSSYQAAISAYEEAYRRFPPEGGSLSDAWFRDVRDLLPVGSTKLRPGYASSPDSGLFLAMATQVGDTLSFTPYPQSRFFAAREERSPAERDAIARGRQTLLQLARMWRTRLPATTSAREAVAVALDLLGNASALDTLSAIRRNLPAASPDRARLAVLEVWMRVKHATPDDLSGLRVARALADSVLADVGTSDPSNARPVAGLAAVIGRARSAAAYARAAGIGGIPLGLEDVAPSLLAYCAMGGPRDSIRSYAAELQHALEHNVPIGDRSTTRIRWLIRAASLAAPDDVLNVTLHLEIRENPLEMLLDAWRRNDRTAARSLLLDLRRHRLETGIRPEDVSLDAAYAEAAILAALGDADDAVAWLDPALGSLASTSTEAFADLTRGAALVRAMSLRATLARERGDSKTARRWALAALTLWSGADPELGTSLDPLRMLAER